MITRVSLLYNTLLPTLYGHLFLHVVILANKCISLVPNTPPPPVPPPGTYGRYGNNPPIIHQPNNITD